MSGGFPPDTQTHAERILNAMKWNARVDEAEDGREALDALLVELAAARTERDRWKEKAGRWMDWYRDETTPLRDARDDAIQALRHYANRDHWDEVAGTDVFPVFEYDGGDVPWKVADAALTRLTGTEPPSPTNA